MCRVFILITFFLTVLAAAGTILNITYGYIVKDCDDPLVTLADECTLASVAAGGPGALLCDLVPARESPNLTVEFAVTFPRSKILANVGSFLWVQETCSVYKDTRREVLRPAIPVGESPNGTSSCNNRKDGRKLVAQAEGTATQCIAVDLLETMRTQSGPYRASETIDTSDILHIGGVLYAGESTDPYTCYSLADPWCSRVGNCEGGDYCAVLT